VPRFAEDRGPSCWNLPNPPWSQAHPLQNVPNYNDGVDEPLGTGIERPAPGFGAPTADELGYDGSPEDVKILRRMMVGRYGAGTDSGLGVLLAGPAVADGGGR
jgi:phospholipid/cholesterol/gamma-HCH transport system substrate-binding protein